jgi:hypothetical protein
MTPKPSRGGARKGAGRKPRTVPRVPITVRLEPMDAEKLKQECKRLGVSQSKWVMKQIELMPYPQK